jgi:hypothetical protein
MVDATTLGLGKRPPQLVEEAPTVVPPGNGGVSPATVSGQRHRSRKGPDRNAFSAELTNVRSVLFKTGLMGLDPDEPVVAILRGTGRTTLRFTRGLGPVTVRLEAGQAKRVVIRP